MALKIRLSRGGDKKNAHYSIVVIPATSKRDGKPVEKIGHYHPCLKDESKRLFIEAAKISQWLEKGAQPTEVVVKLMKKAGLEVPAKYDVKYSESKHKGMSKKEIADSIKKQQAEEAARKKAKAEAKKAADAAAAATASSNA